jgi:hypothetical protein
VRTVKLAAKRQIDGAAEHNHAVWRREILGWRWKSRLQRNTEKMTEWREGHNDKHPRACGHEAEAALAETGKAQREAKSA